MGDDAPSEAPAPTVAQSTSVAGTPTEPATCHIRAREVRRTALAVDLVFEAVTLGPDGESAIASSPEFSQPSYEPEPSQYSSRAHELLDALVKTVIAQGWEPTDPQPGPWYARRFRRPHE